MVAELISVGTELLMGNVVNTNVRYLAEKLSGLGYVIQYQVTVGDNAERLRAVVQEAWKRSDLVVLTGGLGPTEDDITKDVCAELLGMPLRLDEALRDWIEDYLKRSVYKCPSENNYRQAMIPEGAVQLKNENGTARGLVLEKDGRRMVLLPGPPNELQPMVEQELIPYLHAQQEDCLYSVMVKICGIGEAQIEDRLLDLIDAQTNPTIATYAKTGETHVRITAKASSAKEAAKLVKPVAKEIRKRFGSAVYSFDAGETLPMAVVKQLKKYDLTVTTAESITGGMIAAALTSVSGASSVFKEGFITYSNKAKRRTLSVKKDLIKRYGAVSAECAKDMAVGGVLASEADICIAVTGNAGPEAMEEKPVGLVYIGCYCRGKVVVESYQFNGNRDKIREQTVIKALDLLRRTILEKYGKD